VAVVASRILEWFWLRSAEQAARSGSSAPVPRVLELAGRAAVALEAATRTERPAEPFAHAGNDAVAAELYREAIHWTLLAHEERAAPATGADATDLAALLERADRALLVRAAGGEKELDALRLELRAGSYREFAELGAGAQRALVERVGTFAQALLEPLSTLERQLERIWVRRVVHVLGVVLLVVGVVGGLRQYLRHRERQHDLAAHATWTTSSIYPVGGCPSPKQTCEGGENYFFHTGQEADPWITFDLGAKKGVSAVEIDNRLDCCAERALPLYVAVSSDGTHWKDVVHHGAEFTSVRLEFEPVRARYVRIHLPKAGSILHLSRVRIYP